MKHKYRLAFAFSLMVTVAFWACPPPAHAYLDPSTGGSMAQFVIATLIGAGYAIQRFWRRLFDFFKKGRLAREHSNV